MWHHTHLTQRLGLQWPIVQGPFGGGLSSPALVAAVSDAGGLGSFGVHHLRADGIRATAAAIRQRTARPFALNLWIPMGAPPVLDKDGYASAVGLLAPYLQELGMPMPAQPEAFWPPYEEQIEAVLEARPAVFSFVFGIPSPEVLQRCKSQGIVTLGTATTVDEAQALARAGVDMVVATGFEAGGHRVSFLHRPEDVLTGTMALVPQVVDAVDIPVIAAGGIADGRGVAAALALGAQGVQIGTAFLACQESATSDLHRAKLFSPDSRHTALTRVFSGRLARGIRNRFVQEMEAHRDKIPDYPIQNWLTATFKAEAVRQGRDDLVSLWCGQAAPLLRHHTAAALMDSLTRGASAALSRGHRD